MDRPDLAPMRDRGQQGKHQREGWSVIFYFSFSFSFFSLLACPPCWSCVGEAKKKNKKKKDTGVRRIMPVSVFDTCRTLTRCQKWRVVQPRMNHAIKSYFSARLCKNPILPFKGNHHSRHGSLHGCIRSLLYPSDYATHWTSLLWEWARVQRVPNPTSCFVNFVGHSSFGHGDRSTGVWLV